MKLINAIVVVFALGLIIINPTYANIIINGSFETPDIPPGELGPVGGWENFYLPILGWTPILPGGMEIQDHVVGEPGQAWEAYDGDQLAEMDGIPPFNNGGMYQTVNKIYKIH